MGLLAGARVVVVEIGGDDEGSLGSVAGVACVSVGAEATGRAGGSG
jgi:hypothetical protein